MGGKGSLAPDQQHPVKPTAAVPAHQPDAAALALWWDSRKEKTIGLPTETVIKIRRRLASRRTKLFDTNDDICPRQK
jgi:hypothetical protein